MVEEKNKKMEQVVKAFFKENKDQISYTILKDEVTEEKQKTEEEKIEEKIKNYKSLIDKNKKLKDIYSLQMNRKNK